MVVRRVQSSHGNPALSPAANVTDCSCRDGCEHGGSACESRNAVRKGTKKLIIVDILFSWFIF